MVHNSIGVVTALLPHIGYKKCLWQNQAFTCLVEHQNHLWFQNVGRMNNSKGNVAKRIM